jgi:hypothetical protein
MAAGATYEPIATTTVGTATPTITFSSISNAYTDLRLVVQAFGTTNNNVRITFNGVTTTSYSQTNLAGDGAAAASDRVTNTASIQATYGGTGTGTQTTLICADIFSYAGSTFKSLLISNSNDRNGSGFVANIIGLFRSTSAITSIELSRDGGNHNTGTTATLYGIKAA